MKSTRSIYGKLLSLRSKSIWFRSNVRNFAVVSVDLGSESAFFISFDKLICISFRLWRLLEFWRSLNGLIRHECWSLESKDLIVSNRLLFHSLCNSTLVVKVKSVRNVLVWKPSLVLGKSLRGRIYQWLFLYLKHLFSMLFLWEFILLILLNFVYHKKSILNRCVARRHFLLVLDISYSWVVLIILSTWTFCLKELRDSSQAIVNLLKAVCLWRWDKDVWICSMMRRMWGLWRK